MAGNVWEWVEDAWSTDDPANGVLRGGSWDFAPTHLTTTIRTRSLRANAHVSTGFRCARSP